MRAAASASAATSRLGVLAGKLGALDKYVRVQEFRNGSGRAAIARVVNGKNFFGLSSFFAHEADGTSSRLTTAAT